MRISCNGCRVLRKGCSEDCTLRPCLDWLTSPESQSNATLFLAKFYGRAGLSNLISAAPTCLRPEIFKSLLYEACGRIINPVSGSVGLITSGEWPRCHAAVEEVLSGDIRRVAKRSAASPARVETRSRRRRSESAEFCVESEAKFTITGWGCGGGGKDFVIDRELARAASHDSDSVETVELNLARFDERVGEPESRLSEVELELTLGLNPLYHYLRAPIEISDSEE